MVIMLPDGITHTESGITGSNPIQMVWNVRSTAIWLANLAAGQESVEVKQ
jgi:hypothetical protein